MSGIRNIFFVCFLKSLKKCFSNCGLDPSVFKTPGCYLWVEAKNMHFKYVLHAILMRPKV